MNLYCFVFGSLLNNQLGFLTQGSGVDLRFEKISDGSDLSFPILFLIAMILMIIVMYRRISSEVSFGRRWLLTALRILFVIGLFVCWLEPVIVRMVNYGKVILLIDNSASMQLPLTIQETAPSPISRGEAVLDHLRNSEIIKRLSDKYSVEFYTFNTVGNITEVSPLNDESVNKIMFDGKETALLDSINTIIKRKRDNSCSAVLLYSDGCDTDNHLHHRHKLLTGKEETPLFIVGTGPRSIPFSIQITRMTTPNRSNVNHPLPVDISLSASGDTAFNNDLNHSDNIDDLLSKDIPCRLALFFLPDTAANNTDTMKDALSLAKSHQPVEEMSLLWSQREKRFIKVDASPCPFPLSLNITPTKSGKFLLLLQVSWKLPPFTGQKEKTTYQLVKTEIVEHRDKVLVMAGGPNRDFQFLKSRLQRDKEIDAVVSLPDENGKSISLSKTELSSFDVVVLMDPDWNQLGTPLFIENLEKWIAREAGGLIITTGPVYAGKTIDSWIDRPDFAKIRALYPVTFFSSNSPVPHEIKTGSNPRRLLFAMQNSGIELFEDLFTLPLPNEHNTNIDTVYPQKRILSDWHQFPGFYSSLAIERVKPAATLLAELQPANVDAKYPLKNETKQSGKAVVFAWQWYGNGRVFYIGNGETWRLRSLDESAFDRFWLRLIHFVAMGRREKPSPYGRLDTDKKLYTSGQNVHVQAQLNDAQFEPLHQETVELVITHKTDSTNRTKKEESSTESKADEKATIEKKTMTMIPDNPGSYRIDWTAEQPGTVQLRLPVPGMEVILENEFVVHADDREGPPSLLNDTLLRQLADESGGRYDSIENLQKKQNLNAFLDSFPNPSQRMETDSNGQIILSGCLLTFLLMLLLAEWLIRRLSRLV